MKNYLRPSLLNLRKVILVNNTKKQILLLTDPHTHHTENLMIEAINLIDEGLIKYPNLKSTVSDSNFVENLINDYLDYLRSNHLLSFSDRTLENINYKLNGLLPDADARKEFTNEILKIIEDDLGAMEQNIIRTKASDLAISLSHINRDE